MRVKPEVLKVLLLIHPLSDSEGPDFVCGKSVGGCVRKLARGPVTGKDGCREVHLTLEGRLTWTEMRPETGLPEPKLSTKINLNYMHTRRAK